MRDPEHQPGRAGRLPHLDGVGRRGGHRLLAEHVATLRQRRHHVVVVPGVLRAHDDCVRAGQELGRVLDPARAARLGELPASVDLVGGRVRVAEGDRDVRRSAEVSEVAGGVSVGRRQHADPQPRAAHGDAPDLLAPGQ